MSLIRQRSAGYMTNWAARLFAREIDRRLKPLGISSAHLPVFFALGDGEALSQKALTAAAEVEQPTMAATLTRMERDGLVSRAPDPQDRRSTLFSLTPVALEKVAAVREATDGVNALALAGVDESERAALISVLERMIAALGAAGTAEAVGADRSDG